MKMCSISMVGLIRIIATALVLLVPATATSVRSAEVGSYADVTVDRSTPEQHLRTFLTALHRTVIRLEAREWARQRQDAWLYPAITPEQSAEINLLKSYVLDSMDLTGFPDWRRESAGIETALMLGEILKAEQVTKTTSFRKLRENLWVIPGTYIQVGVIESGMRMGDVVFTAETVANVPSFYRLLPQRSNVSGFDSYRYFTETPGGLEPPRWAGISQKLPDPLRWSVGSNTVFQWLITALIFIGVLLIPTVAARMVPLASLRWFCHAAFTGLLSSYATRVLIDEAGLSGAGATVMTLVFLALAYGAAVICVLIVGEWVANWLSAVQQAKDKTFDTSIIRLAARVVSAMSALAIVIYGISAAGVPVYGIIAGFGVGGLAVALAAKPTLENILAGVILFLDGSIKVGDTIESGALTGTIEDIGMRSTRIRSADGGLISVTNSELADKVIKNMSHRIISQKSQGQVYQREEENHGIPG